MKKVSSLALLISSILSTSAYAGDLNLPVSFSGNVGVYSDYRFRGISQTQEDPALQADVTMKHDSGFKLTAWGSNIDFNNTKSGSTELDITAAYQRELFSKLTGEVGVIYYAYPGSDGDLNYDYVEEYASLGYDFGVASINASLNYSNDFFGESGTSWYPHLSVTVPLPNSFALDGGIGRQYIDDEAAFGLPDYTEWMLGAHYDFKGNTVSIKYQDTDVDDDACAVGCGATVVVGFSRQF